MDKSDSIESRNVPVSMTRTQRAIDFYRLAFNGTPDLAVEKYVGSQYIQHNPLLEDGPEGFVRYFARMAREFPEKSVEFLRAVAEDDLVALHTHQVWAGDGEYVTMDFFRFDANDKIVEHWDAVQKVPEHSANGNSMY